MYTKENTGQRQLCGQRSKTDQPVIANAKRADHARPGGCDQLGKVDRAPADSQRRTAAGDNYVAVSAIG